jgi:hypothetical protein
MTHTFAFLCRPDDFRPRTDSDTGRRVAYTFPVTERDYVDWLTTRHAEHAAIIQAVDTGPPHHLLRFAHRVITCADYAPENEAIYYCASATIAATLAYDLLKQDWAQEDKQQKKERQSWT